MTHKYIPVHLQKFLVEQDYSKYTAIDQACWRYILKISKAFFTKHAHRSFLIGLEEFGISTEKIPRIEEMDKKLSRFGWGAVCVRGFIPPSVFMELQSLQVLAIAADMRILSHLNYTPAPDIVHETIGHAPIIADSDYAEYLKQYGKIASRAISSREDMAIYNAIRELSDIKEYPDATEKEIRQLELQLSAAYDRKKYNSEAAYLTRMNWWTVEYGLIGDINNPKIYGAGLLSSVGESFNCLRDHVKKIPFSVDCIHQAYDITEPQPQLFVTPNFKELTRVINEFSETMAYKTGGRAGLEKALLAGTVNTCEYDSGVQVSGILSQVLYDKTGDPCYMVFSGHVQISYHDKQLSGHGGSYHHMGFGSPISNIENHDFSTVNVTKELLENSQISLNQEITLNFKGGIQLKGILSSIYEEKGQILLLSFSNCSVKQQEGYLFNPDWGVFDMVCGSRIVSVFGGPADSGEYYPYMEELNPKNDLPAGGVDKTHEELELIHLYKSVHEILHAENIDFIKLEQLTEKLISEYPDDWLLIMNILEYAGHSNFEWIHNIRNILEERKHRNDEYSSVIERGLSLLPGH